MTQEVTTQDLPAISNLEHYMTAGELTKQALLVQEILDKVMVGPTPENPEGVHYGIVPGTKKPTLLQPGAEKICATFHLAPKYHVEDLSEPHSNFYRYRVTCSLYTIRDGLFVGAACGEASSAEEKFMWERPVCDQEWEETDPSNRRIKYYPSKTDPGFTTTKQIRRNAADISNTVLKIGCKRSFVSATRGATAASDLLDVDLEEAVPPSLLEGQQAEQQAAKPKAKPKPAPIIPYGPHKGQQITDPDVSLNHLQSIADSTARGIADPKREKFKAQNELFLKALQAEITHRQTSSQEVPAKPLAETSQPTPEPSKPQTQGKSRGPFGDSAWADFLLYCEEECPAAYRITKEQFRAASGHDVDIERRWAFYDVVTAYVNQEKKSE